MTHIKLADFSSSGRLLGTRHAALGIRALANASLDLGEVVTFDFAGTNPTQAFVDELIGALVTDRGEQVLQQLVMQNCDKDVKTILHFVVDDRLEQLEKRAG